MKLIIAGSRGYKGGVQGVRWAVYASGWRWRITEVIEGEARGADAAGRLWAEEEGLPVTPMPAPWNDVFGKPKHEIGNSNGRPYWKPAGHHRNRQMSERADAAVILWDGKSPGTESMIQIMKDINKPVFVWMYLCGYGYYEPTGAKKR
ncbi:hypothetical protein Rctr71_060 [Virus Rctr71]|nr:hypothetical protein Rctr71_060 [Virus Rctr71]